MREPHILQESDVLEAQPVLWTAFAAVAVLVATGLVTLLFQRAEAAPTNAGNPVRAPAHLGMLEQAPFEAPGRGQRLQQRQHARLEHYGWVDRQAGLAHIPIEAAMTLSLERNR